MTRFAFSPTGALKWKKDVNEYAEVLATFGVASAAEDMGCLQQLVNVLIVAPDSLLGLVNGSLRLPHRCATSEHLCCCCCCCSVARHQAARPACMTHCMTGLVPRTRTAAVRPINAHP